MHGFDAKNKWWHNQYIHVYQANKNSHKNLTSLLRSIWEIVYKKTNSISGNLGIVKKSVLPGQKIIKPITAENHSTQTV